MRPKMTKALTSIIISIVMVASSVSAIAADTANTSSSKSTPAVQAGPLPAGGPVVVSPAQADPFDTISGTLCPGGDCTPALVGLGVLGMGAAIAGAMGAFSNSKTMTTVSTTGTGG